MWPSCWIGAVEAQRVAIVTVNINSTCPIPRGKVAVWSSVIVDKLFRDSQSVLFFEAEVRAARLFRGAIVRETTQGSKNVTKEVRMNAEKRTGTTIPALLS